MARPRRIEIPGGIHHVTTRGVRRLPVFRCDADFELFLSLLGLVATRLGWRVHGYCLIPNHYHLVIETPEPNLSQGMHALNGRYARAFNERYGLTGHVFEARFGAEPVRRGAHAIELVRYVHLNPVRAGLSATPSEWRWSSYRALAGHEPAPAWLAVADLLALFVGPPGRERERLVRFVADGLAAPVPARRARPP